MSSALRPVSPLPIHAQHWDTLDNKIRQIRGLMHFLEHPDDGINVVQPAKFVESCAALAEIVRDCTDAMEASTRVLFEDWEARQ